VNEQIEFVKLIAQRLDSAGIAYMLTGSLAMSMYAEPRMTRDIDLVVACQPEDADAIVRLFSDDCYIDADVVREAARARAMFNIIHRQWIVKADFIVQKDEEYRRIEFDRRRGLSIEGRAISVVAPEDLILSKLLWALPEASELQLRDARALIAGVHTLDWDYLEQWADRLGLLGMLDQVREP
jgi:hypothetical protein